MLQEEIRHGAIAQVRARTKPESRLRRVWAAIASGVSRDWLTSLLVAIGVTSLMVALVLMTTAWPPGGGEFVSEAAIALGASLIFVVILLGLLAPAIEAGRSIGWDASWIRNDPTTWVSLILVAGISLFLVWLGAERPQRAEETAAIFLAGSSLAMTALIARRMIGFADPAVQLAERRRREARTVSKLIDEAVEQSRSALSGAGIEAEVAAPITDFPSRYVQDQVAESIKRVLSSSRMAWHRGEWVLAAQSHVQAIVLAMQYADSVGALSSDDRVFELIRTESDDLHEMADGPEGRWLSLTVLQNLVECGIAVVNTRKAAMPHHGSDQLAYYFAMTIESLLQRRLSDMKTQDVSVGLDGIKRLALAEAANGHSWGAATIASLGLKWAPIGVEAGMAHVAWPAWSCGMEVLKSLATAEDIEGNGFRSLTDDFLTSLGRVSGVSRWLTNGLEPIIGHWVADSTLVGLGYTVWQAPERRLEDVARLAQDASAQVVRLVSSTDESWQHATSKNGGDVIYHLTAACATRVASGQVEAASSRSVCDDALQNGLGWLRRLVVEEGQVREHYATRDLLHIYLSAWQVILFALRERSELPDDVRAEHEALMDALSDAVLADLPPDLMAEGLHRLARWLEQEGYPDLAERTRAKRENTPEPTPGFSPFSTWGWGLLGGDYHTYRGSMMGGFFDRVEAHFAG